MNEILELVKNGPVPVRTFRNRKAAFKLEYRRLLQEGAIVEHGRGTRQDPKYVGLPGAEFPGPRLTVQIADVCLLMLVGVPEVEARERLKTAIASGGEGAVIELCREASGILLREGFGPSRVIPATVQRKWRGKMIEPLVARSEHCLL